MRLREREKLKVFNTWYYIIEKVSIIPRAFLKGPDLWDRISDRMPYRFVHTADIHLDSPLRSLALRDPDLAELIGNASRQALTNIVDLCLDEQVDALLLAGDLYDGDQTSMKTARFLATQVRKLHEAGIRVFIIRGNHDALSKITRELVYPEETVKVFNGKAEAIHIDRPSDEIPVVIHGLSFTEPQAPESLIHKYKPPVEGAVNIAMMHTSLDGTPGHDPYAPCKMSDLQAAGFQYWALGHIHKRSVTEEVCTVVMPGTPQGRDINEAGMKSVSLVTISDDGSIRIEERTTNIVQFERVSVDATGIDDWDNMVSALGRELRRVRNRASAEHIIVRLRVIGKTSLAWRIRRDSDLLKTEADEHAATVGYCWVEKLVIDCHTADIASEDRSDPVAELRQLITSDVAQSESYRQEATRITEELINRLPRELRDFLGSNENSFQETLESLAAEGTEDVLASLHAVAGHGEA